MTKPVDKIREAAEALGDAEKADLLIYNGEIGRIAEYKFIDTVCKRRKRDRVILTLVTPGGDADAAYRMARTLQSNYSQVTLFVSGWCKSAGTLLAIGAHRLVMSEFGELGPLDIQLGKRDELFEFGSGLDIDATMKQLEALSFGMFEDVMLAIETSSQGRITFKTASQLSAELTTKLFASLYAQIDPIEIGKTSRLMTIATDYGERLKGKAKNFKRTDALDILISSYSAHSFVIDFEEASDIFRNVEKANPLFVRFQEAMGNLALTPIESQPGKEYVLAYLNKEIADEPDPQNAQPGGTPVTPPEGTGTGQPADGGGHDAPHSGPPATAPGVAPPQPEPPHDQTG